VIFTDISIKNRVNLQNYFVCCLDSTFDIFDSYEVAQETSHFWHNADRLSKKKMKKIGITIE
jgi:hypothetical protein